jgi:V-type H+-transporting ATPase subunit a
MEATQQALRDAVDRADVSVQSVMSRKKTKKKPPTFFRTNKFTQGFQNIVDAYGVASYREINPAVFAIITFPFLFAVMFGDLGHGILMSLAAYFLIWKERELSRSKGGEIFNTMFGGRYIIFLMGIFSMYTGLIYNDTFSRPLNLFGSAWSFNSTLVCPSSDDKEALESEYVFNLIKTGPNSESYYYGNGYSTAQSPYVFGVDPMWAVASNKLVFLNSFKMKTAVILGFMQMMFGVILSFFNHRYFKRGLSIYFEFIPQVRV